jgi:chromosome partitioning protein
MTSRARLEVVALVSQKGGSGKTTLAVALAVAAERAGRPAAIIDLDPQATAALWGDRRQNAPPVVVSAQAPRLAQVLAAAGEGGAELVFIDTPPRLEGSALAAVKAARVVLIPCRPSLFDLETTAATLELIRLAGGPPPVAVLNGVPATGAERQEATRYLRTVGVDVCPVVLGQRKAFALAGALGQAPQETDPASKAAREVAGVYRFLSKLLK